MLPRHFIRHIAAAVALVFGVSGAAKAECQAFPKVPWWSNLSHGSVVRYVDERHGGDWAAYIAKWDRQSAKLEDIASRGNVAVIGKNKVRLRDAALDDYIGTVAKRLRVIRCLSLRQEARIEKEAAALDGFATAAGGDQPNGASVTQAADAFRGNFKVEVGGRCRDGATRFQVVNTGAPWPKPATIFIYRVGSAKPLSQRRLRMARGQRATFEIDNPKVGATALGLWVEPSWYARDFRYDATQSCPSAVSSLSVGPRTRFLPRKAKP
jgi:hypothetical protein